MTAVRRAPLGPWRRAALGLILAALTLVVTAGPVAADPVGPTDYRTEIVEVEPPTPQVGLTILGGDSFVELTADPGVEVRVTGYRGEPYLWFDRAGTVWQNERSSSRWLNDDRFGEADIPAVADDDAEPEWVAVADDGVYAWHDHRAHWMNPAKPPGAEPGDVILEAVIPLDVEGADVAVHVRSYLLSPPSPLAAAVGAGLGAIVGLWFLAQWRRSRSAAADRGTGQGGTDVIMPQPVAVLVVVIVSALVATVVGAAAVVGLPAEAAPGPARWLLPLVAVIVGVGALYLTAEDRMAPPLAALLVPASLVLAGSELLLWGWLRRQVLIRALVPSPIPEWIDRAVVAGAAAVGLVAVAAALLSIRERRPAPRPTR